MRRLALGLALAGLACAAQREFELDRAYQAGVAAVERVDVNVNRKRPISVDVSVFGQLPDACTLIHHTRQERRDTGIAVTLTTRRESRARCAAEPQPFQRTIALDIHGLPPGLYFVSVNGLESTFQIPTDTAVPDPLDRYWVR